MKQAHPFPKQRLLTAALLLALASPSVYAQNVDADNDESEQAAELDEIVVKGIRGSMTSSMNLKRDSTGVVDGIVAEDIGKFPDTNLAESLQRITGVSIDRSNGEGSRVTVRGVGPDFNLVLLNGRQMPGSSIGETGPSNSRAFDFANLASEAIAEVEVYKTGRAATPTGGIGATINIKTAKPLEAPGFRANVGVKGVHDTSNGNLPGALQGDDFTPEISGIFSNTSEDGRFGVALTGSYQERDLGYNQAAVANGWRPFAGDENNWGTIPQPGTPGSQNIINRPGPTDIYSVPQNLVYSVNGLKRQRTNGQLTFQFAPTDNITTTLDYTYSQNKIQQQRNELSVWFNFGPSTSSWTNGPVAGPNFYSETINPANSDLAMGGAAFATKSDNDSIGFNVEWDVSNDLGLEFDIHSSSAETGADSPYGSNAVLGTAGFFRGTTTVDFTRDFPVMSVQLPPGMSSIDPSAMLVTGSSFRNSYMKSDVDQGQIKGHFDFAEASRLDFGVSITNVKNRTAFSNVQRDTWGGATSPADYPDSVWHLQPVRPFFDNINGSGNPALFNQFFIFDFETVRQLAAAAAGNESLYLRSDVFTTDRRVEEKSRSAYLQYSTTFDTSMPINLNAGVRFEKTDVTSTALVPTATGIVWVANNEFSVQFGDPGYTTLRGDYQYTLPNLDLSIETSADTILRFSYGESIGRPGWGDIQGGQTLNQLARINGGTGAQGNPALKPLESQNFDVSFEWYYGESSYLSLGYFRKNIDNYIGVTTVQATPFELHTPAGGSFFNQAIANGCPQADVTCIRNYIFDNFSSDPSVTRGPNDPNGNRTGTIAGRPSDPIATFLITTPANQRSASLDGWEFNIQHVFGETGFGVSANYTMVDSGLSYDNYDRGEQFALEGVSDSANLVGFYEKYNWSVRLAYNWRDEFLAGRFDGTGLPNPVYTEAYGQWDMNVGYQWNDQLSFQFEAINLTDEIQRLHGRTENQVLYVTQTGPRYMVGFRYKF